MTAVIALDIGNSQTKIRFGDSPLLITVPNELIANNNIIQESHDYAKFFAAITTNPPIVSVSSVIDNNKTEALIEQILKQFKINDYLLKIWKSSEILSLVLPNQFKELSHIGSDRALRIYYLNHFTHSLKAQLSFGCGTAFTLEVTQQEHFKESKILPGLELQLNSLYKQTAKLPSTHITEAVTILEKKQLLSTSYSIVDGIISSYCLIIKEAVNKWQIDNIICSGGYAPLICNSLLDYGIRANYIDNIETLVLAKLVSQLNIN